MWNCIYSIQRSARPKNSFVSNISIKVELYKKRQFETLQYLNRRCWIFFFLRTTINSCGSFSSLKFHNSCEKSTEIIYNDNNVNENDDDDNKMAIKYFWTHYIYDDDNSNNRLSILHNGNDDDVNDNTDYDAKTIEYCIWFFFFIGIMKIIKILIRIQKQINKS